ncbi:hypothetical protein [Actinokineospora xionganensis]|uniref:Quinol monooxygenase YgiN n=1 Tax=Actinokineospora xionganensis TaxID=2684470 RepID=A0ABR7L3Z6_9PSEU|nr:hypothetical protein [Actinokineospora xionganensis]MBC6447406.1 hypothetical protein [Actinokineospora xionganensis]
MSTMFVVRYTTRPDAADENQGAVEKVFAELAENQPDGLRYATFRLADGVTFVHVAVTEGEDNPLRAVTAFAEFQAGIADRLAGPVDRSEATLVGSYRVMSA